MVVFRDISDKLTAMPSISDKYGLQISTDSLLDGRLPQIAVARLHRLDDNRLEDFLVASLCLVSFTCWRQEWQKFLAAQGAHYIFSRWDNGQQACDAAIDEACVL